MTEPDPIAWAPLVAGLVLGAVVAGATYALVTHALRSPCPCNDAARVGDTTSGVDDAPPPGVWRELPVDDSAPMAG